MADVLEPELDSSWYIPARDLRSRRPWLRFLHNFLLLATALAAFLATWLLRHHFCLISTTL